MNLNHSPTLQPSPLLQAITTTQTHTQTTSTTSTDAFSSNSPTHPLLTHDATRKRRRSDDEGTFQSSGASNAQQPLDAHQAAELKKLVESMRLAGPNTEKLRSLIATAIHKDSLPDEITGQLMCELPDLQKGVTEGIEPLLDSLAARLGTRAPASTNNDGGAATTTAPGPDQGRPVTDSNDFTRAAVEIYANGGDKLKRMEFIEALRNESGCSLSTATNLVDYLRAWKSDAETEMAKAYRYVTANPSKSNEELSEDSTRAGDKIAVSTLMKARTLLRAMNEQGLVQIDGLGVRNPPNTERTTTLLDHYFTHPDLSSEAWTDIVSHPDFGIHPRLSETAAQGWFSAFKMLADEVRLRSEGSRGTNQLSRVLDTLLAHPDWCTDSKESISAIFQELKNNGVNIDKRIVAKYLRLCLYAINTGKIALAGPTGAAAASTT
ncbi:MAG: hypothetical protein KA795_01935 [Burkholderiaceae bacterium]|nr:hypothetical protein [Burkholderiaceae bacterium]